MKNNNQNINRFSERNKKRKDLKCKKNSYILKMLQIKSLSSLGKDLKRIRDHWLRILLLSKGLTPVLLDLIQNVVRFTKKYSPELSTGFINKVLTGIKNPAFNLYENRYLDKAVILLSFQYIVRKVSTTSGIVFPDMVGGD